MIKKHVKKIIQNGRGSYYINIPRELMKELGWRERQKTVLKKSGKKIIIQDWPV